METVIEKIKEAMMHLATNYDIDENRMDESDAYDCLKEALGRAENLVSEKFADENEKIKQQICPKATQCANTPGGLKCPKNVICPIM